MFHFCFFYLIFKICTNFALNFLWIFCSFWKNLNRTSLFNRTHKKAKRELYSSSAFTFAFIPPRFAAGKVYGLLVSLMREKRKKSPLFYWELLMYLFIFSFLFYFFSDSTFSCAQLKSIRRSTGVFLLTAIERERKVK